MKAIWLFLKWMMPHRLTYSEKEGVDLTSLALDMVVQKATRGKIGYGGAHAIKQKCKICKITFWSNRKRPVCLRWKCYRRFYSGTAESKATRDSAVEH